MIQNNKRKTEPTNFQQNDIHDFFPMNITLTSSFRIKKKTNRLHQIMLISGFFFFVCILINVFN